MAKSLKEQLSKIALKKLRLSNGETLAEALASEARRLYDCIQYYIDEYYRSYEPLIYDRTYRYQGALYAESIADIRIVGDTLRIGVAFNNSLSMHPNLDYVYREDQHGNEHWIPISDKHDTFVPLMMEKGWNSPRLASMIGKPVYRLTYFEGIRAVEQGVADFNRTNKLGIRVNADDFYNGKAY